MTRPMHTAVKDPADIDQLAQHPVAFRRVAGLFRPHRGTLLLVVALIIATSGLTVVQPFLVRRTVDEAIPEHDTALLLWLVIAYALSVLVSRIMRRFGLYRLVWHRALFNFALYVCLLGGVVYLSEFLP